MARGQGVPLDGTKLRAAREAAGLSQREVAERVGTPRQKVVRYEGGRERPEARRLAALAAAVGVDVAALVEEGALPAGLAGLRVGAGLTLAAAAGAVRAHTPVGAGIACSRPVLAAAEHGVLPPTWAPPPAAGAVRNAFRVAYGAGVEAVATAWESTFGAADESLSETAPSVAVADTAVDMGDRIGPGWILRREGPAQGHTWLVMHEGRVRGKVRRYRPRSGGLSRGWEALLGSGGRQGYGRRSATDEGKFGRSSFLWRSRDLAAWGIATNPAFSQPSPGWARRAAQKRRSRQRNAYTERD